MPGGARTSSQQCGAGTAPARPPAARSARPGSWTRSALQGLRGLAHPHTPKAERGLCGCCDQHLPGVGRTQPADSVAPPRSQGSPWGTYLQVPTGFGSGLRNLHKDLDCSISLCSFVRDYWSAIQYSRAVLSCNPLFAAATSAFRLAKQIACQAASVSENYNAHCNKLQALKRARKRPSHNISTTNCRK